MAKNFEFRFVWDPVKADSNWRKHGVSFDLAATVFNDPFMISTPDLGHDGFEERWVTIGQAGDSKLLLVIHTYVEINESRARIRLISARPATKRERRQYEVE